MKARLYGPPMKGCGICNETGKVTQAFFETVKGGPLASVSGEPGTPCLCTVTQEAIAEALPDVMAGIMKRIDKP